MESVDFSEESLVEESTAEESVVEESTAEESAVEESTAVESAVEESTAIEFGVEESSTAAELYSAEVVQSLETLAVDLENTNLVLMCFFVLFCVVSLRNIVFGICKNIFGR